MNISNYLITELISESKKTLIYKGKNKINQNSVIIKMLVSDNPQAKEEDLKHEFEILSNLKSERVIKTYGLETIDGQLALILENFTGDLLKTAIIKKTPDLRSTIRIAMELAQGLGEIHHQHIIYKDVKPENILVNVDTLQVKYIDFGISTQLSREVQQMVNPSMLEGTLAYISPEQTGRMNRPLDYRTDLYSLGVTLYQLFTKKVPFEFDNPMELIHAHIAKSPMPPDEVDPTLPRAISNIILKCMAKEAEERYQSAFGLKNDLEACLNQLNDKGAIDVFLVGQNDIYDHFHIPSKLYGREKEIQHLYKNFQEITSGKAKLLNVKGYSGIGKTSLVNEVQQPLIRKEGYFIRGKFDLFKRDIPYLGFIQALQDLVRQILTESDEQLDYWKIKITKALGDNSKVICDVIHELKLLIGEPADVPVLPPKESENRFNYTLSNFIDAFCEWDHPLVMFLDDLQWADANSLRFIEYFMTDLSHKNFLLIGAYRDNEVDPHHPLIMTIDNLKKFGTSVDELEILPLELKSVEEIIQDTFHSSHSDILELSRLVYQKTRGNPFFINQFLKDLYKKNLFNFDAANQNWTADLMQIEKMEVTDNVADLMSKKLKEFGTATQYSLKIGAAIGQIFNLQTLATIQKITSDQIRKDLLPALHEELIFKILEEQSLDSSAISYSFQHDRIRQAAFNLITPEEKSSLHYRIGKALLQNTPPDQLDDSIIDIVNQLNAGKECVVEPQEKLLLAKLNLTAGKKAQHSTAFMLAASYFSVGIEMLEKDSWQSQYELTFELYSYAAFCEQLIENHARAEMLFNKAAQNARTLREKGNLYIEKMTPYGLVHYQKAIADGTEALKLFGLTMPTSMMKLEFIKEILKIKWQLLFKDPESIKNLPILTDEQIKVIIGIYSSIIYPTYGSSLIAPIMALRCATLTLKHGLTEQGLYSLVCYGVVAGSDLLKDYRTCYEFGKVALELIDLFPRNRVTIDTIYITYLITQRWGRHVKELIDPLIKTARLELETGNLPRTASIYLSVSIYSFRSGKPIEEILNEIDHFFYESEKYHFKFGIETWIIMRQLCLALQGLTQYPTESYPAGPFPKERANLFNEILKGELSPTFNYAQNVWNVYLSYLHEQYDQALPFAKKLLNGRHTFVNYPLWDTFYFYYALTLCAISIRDKNYKYRNELNKLQKLISAWAKACSVNFQHQFLLLSAEIAQIEGKKDLALDFYENALKEAKANGFLHEEALIYERLGKFYLSMQKESIANFYLQEAFNGYSKWGATYKANLLRQQFPSLLSTSSFVLPDKGSTQRITQTQRGDTLTFKTTASTTSDQYDINTIIEIFHVISKEIELNKLIQTAMHMIMINAGADKAFLILDHNGKLLVQAELLSSQAQATILDNIPLKQRQDQLCAAAVSFVARSKEPLILNDATHEGNYTTDPYVLAQKPQSIAIFPLIQQEKLVGILYLDNHQLKNVFTESRTNMLSMISTQIAISIENAKFYAELESKVDDRTKELKIKNEKINEAMHQLQSMQEQLIRQEKLKEREMIKNKFGKYIPNPMVLEQIADKDVELGGEEKEVTVLFCDIRNFTSISENLTPKQVVDVLNRFFTDMIDIIRRHHGIVDKFIGDAVMAIFGALETDPQQAKNAVEASLEIQQRMKTFNEDINIDLQIKVGVGINTGKALLGNIGSDERLEYTVIGDTVNVASRVESLNKELNTSILITESTFSQLDSSFKTKNKGKVAVKGKAHEIQVYEIYE